MKEWCPITPRSRKEWSPKTPGSSKSTVREHSAYCEATGPIVQEGFVASRVRALQQLQGERVRSHSPMTPCPRSWIRSCEAHDQVKHAVTPTPASMALRRAEVEVTSSHEMPKFSCRHQNSLSEASTQDPAKYSLSHSVEKAQLLHIPEMSASWTPLLQAGISEESSANGTIAGRMQRSSEIVNEILGPRALPAEQADRSKAWGFLANHESHDHEIDHGQSLRLKKSIADRLGSMVERGWQGMDVFGRSHADRKASDPVLLNFHIHDDRVKRRSHSEGDAPLVEPPPYSRNPSHPTTKDQTYQSQTLQHLGYQSEEEEADPVKEHSTRKDELRRARSIATISNILRRSSSDAALQFPAGFNPNLAVQEDEWSRRSEWLRRSKSHGTVLSTTASAHARAQVNSDVDRKVAAMASVFTADTASSTLGSRRSSTNTQKSARSFSRKTRWKLRWPKLVPMDSQNSIRGHSRIQPMESPKSRKQNQSDHIPLNRLLRNQASMDSLVECGLGDGVGETKASPDEGRQHATRLLMSRYHASMAQLHRGHESQESEYSRNMRDTSSSALLGHSLTAAEPSPARSLSPSKAPSKVGSKRPSISTSTYGTFVTAPGSNSEDCSRKASSEMTQHSPTSFESPTLLISHSSEATKSSPTRSLSPMHAVLDNIGADIWPELVSSSSATEKPEAMSKAVSPRSSFSETKENVPKRSRESTGVSVASVQVSGLPETMNREMKSSGKGVKRIQVTITFDGAADLILDARLDPHGEQEKKDIALIV